MGLRIWLVAAACGMAMAGPALAQENAPGEETSAKLVTPERWAVHVQATDILQYYPSIHSPFQGPNSLRPQATWGNTVDATVYAGVKPWAGGELWLNWEGYQGFAPSNTLGVAGYINGDGAKVGHAHPYGRIARLFFRQTINLGGEADDQAADLNELPTRRTKDRLVLTAGKLNVTDIFDANKYAHDPRTDFLNWSLIAGGSFDYAADAWGYTYGAAAEWYRGDWTWRAGFFDLSNVPNSPILTSDFHQFQLVGEAERRIIVDGHPGAIRLLGFLTRGRIGRYDDAVALAHITGAAADTALVRRYGSRPGLHINFEQEIADGAGLFGRLGWADGAHEAYEYTDIDRTAQIGLQIEGKRWGRDRDEVGVAGVVNGLSRAGQRYLDAGGLGILVGDSRLPHPGDEEIIEAYYSMGLGQDLHLTIDDQFVEHPAYNRDRGPVNVVGLRLHFQH
jgi:high affinity Mn2+ porin